MQKIVDAYNHTKHSATKMVPAIVTLYNAANARENLQRRYGNRDFKALKYCVGTWCESVVQRTFSLKDMRVVGH